MNVYILARRDQSPPDSTTGPSSRPDDDPSEKVIHESSSTSDSERTESDTESGAPKGDNVQGEIVSSTVTSGMSHLQSIITGHSSHQIKHGSYNNHKSLPESRIIALQLRMARLEKSCLKPFSWIKTEVTRGGDSDSDCLLGNTAKPTRKLCDDQSSKKPRESEASASKQHPSLSSTGWQITDTREAGVDSSMHRSDPESEHSKQSSDDISMQDEGNVSDMEDTDNAHIPRRTGRKKKLCKDEFRRNQIREMGFQNSASKFILTDLFLLNIQEKLNHLPRQDNIILYHSSYMADYYFKEDYTIVPKPRAVVYRDRNEQRKLMRLNELHKFSDGTLTRVMEKLDQMVKDFHLYEYNKGMETRKWSEDDKRRSKDFITAKTSSQQSRKDYRSEGSIKV
ncbi:hypothetical protein Tco_0201328 [Tanacetum coccineum]